MPTAIPKLPLRDIHLPEPVSWWPPAPGWWGLACLVLLLLAVLIWIHRRYRNGRLRRAAARELNRIADDYGQHADGQRLAEELSVLLRRMAISHHPRPEAASLTGEAWLAFLDRDLDPKTHAAGFLAGAGRALIEAPYRPGAAIDGPALIHLCRRWIDAQRNGAAR